MARFTGRRKSIAIAFYVLSVVTLALTLERMVIDVFGQMWGTMIVNGLTLICTLTGICGVCIVEKIAIAVYSGWSVISIGLNIVVILIYNDVGLLREKEHILGLTFGNDNWWRTHGVGCPDPPANGTAETGEEEDCTLSYADIETIHASVYLALALISLLLALILLWPKRKQHVYYPDENESFSYVGVAPEYQYPNRPSNHFRKWSIRSHNTFHNASTANPTTVV